MSARNIHSLSIALPQLAIGVPSTSCPSALSGEAETCTLALSPTAQTKADDSTSQSPSWILRNPSTVLKQGLVTPSTPCFSAEDLNKNIVDEAQELLPNPVDMDLPDVVLPTQLPTPSTNSPTSPSELEWLDRYVPLSHLPTPPSSDAELERQSEEDSYRLLDARFYGPAKHIASMIPRNASRAAPSVYELHSILQRANIGLQTISLACCVLDCLSPRFLRQWRVECQNGEGNPEQCEVLAVAALSIAMKFVEDTSYPIRIWAQGIADCLFSTTSLAISERLILADINYSLLGISSPDLIHWNLVEMQRYSDDFAAENDLSLQSNIREKSMAQLGETFPLLSDL